MPLFDRGFTGLGNRVGGMKTDGQANRLMQNRTAKDPQDLELKINDFELMGPEDEDPEDDAFYIHNFKPRSAHAASMMISAGYAEPFDEVKLPFKLKQYFDMNNDEDEDEILDRYTASQVDYGSNTRLNRTKAKTDYEASVKKPPITTAGLGTGRVTARNRSGPGAKWPGAPGVKYSHSKLRDLIRCEVAKHLDEINRKKAIEGAKPEDIKDEASVAANISGYSLPLGASNWRGKWDKSYDPESAVSKKKKKKK